MFIFSYELNLLNVLLLCLYPRDHLARLDQLADRVIKESPGYQG